MYVMEMKILAHEVDRAIRRKVREWEFKQMIENGEATALESLRKEKERLLTLGIESKIEWDSEGPKLTVRPEVDSFYGPLRIMRLRHGFYRVEDQMPEVAREFLGRLYRLPGLEDRIKMAGLYILRVYNEGRDAGRGEANFVEDMGK